MWRPLSWLFGIRTDVGIGVRAALWGAFIALVFGLWVYATDYPLWLQTVVVRLLPQFELKEGNPVTIDLDRETMRMVLTNGLTGRTLVRQLPPIAAQALPVLNEQTYGPFFRELRTLGLGDFEPAGPDTLQTKIVDAVRAAERLLDLAPRPFELPLANGEAVEIEIELPVGQVYFRLERIPRGGARAPIDLRSAEVREPPSLAQFPELVVIAEAVGVGDLHVHPAATAERPRFQGVVVDVAKAAQNGLGPRRPVPPLAAGDGVQVQLKRDPELSAAHVFLLIHERTEKTARWAFRPELLSAHAVPSLDPRNYPKLTDGVAAMGLRMTVPGAAQVVDVAQARAAGFGLGKPQELRLLARTSLPSPTEVLDSLPVLWTERALPQAIGLTLQRIAQGFGWAVLVTLPLGLVMGAFTRIGVFFEPLKLTGMYVPLPALIPLTIAWVGIGEDQIVLFLAICTGVVLLPFVVSAVQAIPQVYLDTAWTLGANKSQIFRYVLVSISWPTLFRGLKTAFAVGWTWIMLAEVIGVQNGLGYIINTSQRRGYIEHVYVVIAVVMLMAFLSNALWNLAHRLLFPYEQERD
jgi:NitT/TauT family transport system permease protein